MTENKVVGIELSSRIIRAAEVINLNKKQPTVKKFFEREIPGGIVRDGEVLDSDLLAHELRLMWSEAKFSTKKVVIGVGGKRVLVRNKIITEMTIENLDKSLEFIVGDELPVPVDESVIDFYPISENTEEHSIEGLLIAGVKEVISNNLIALTKAKLDPIRVDLIPFGVTRAVIDDEKRERAVVILNVSEKSTHVTIIDNGIPKFVRFIPAGYDDIVEAVKKLTGFNFEQSAKTVETIGVGSQQNDPRAQNIVKVINEQVNSIYKSVSNTITYYQQEYGLSNEISLSLLGPGARIPGFASSFSQALRLPLDELYLKGIVKLNKKVTVEGNDYSRLYVPVGLALGEKRG